MLSETEDSVTLTWVITALHNMAHINAGSISVLVLVVGTGFLSDPAPVIDSPVGLSQAMKPGLGLPETGVFKRICNQLVKYYGVGTQFNSTVGPWIQAFTHLGQVYT